MAGEPAFPEAFADALRRRGVTLAWLHQRLAERGHPVSPAALSYWRSGRSQPERGTSRDALVEIERLLRVAPGGLTDRLGPSRRPGPRPGEKTVRELFAETPGVQAALVDLGFSGLNDELLEVVRHLTVDVDATGHATSVQVRAVVQARHDGARRTPLIVTLDEAGRAPRFVPTAGCSLGRQRTDLEAGVFSAELLTERRLGPRRDVCLRAPGGAAEPLGGGPVRPLRRPADGRAAGVGPVRAVPDPVVRRAVRAGRRGRADRGDRARGRIGGPCARARLRTRDPRRALELVSFGAGRCAGAAGPLGSHPCG